MYKNWKLLEFCFQNAFITRSLVELSLKTTSREKIASI